MEIERADLFVEDLFRGTFWLEVGHARRMQSIAATIIIVREIAPEFIVREALEKHERRERGGSRSAGILLDNG